MAAFTSALIKGQANVQRPASAICWREVKISGCHGSGRDEWVERVHRSTTKDLSLSRWNNLPKGCAESPVVPCPTGVLALDTKTGQVCRAACKAWARGNAAGVHFLIAELELGLMLCELASNAGYERYARRAEAKARAAHQAALYHVASLVLAENELREFIDKEGRVNLRLLELSDDLALPLEPRSSFEMQFHIPS